MPTIWPYVLTMGTAAITASAVSVPAIRKFAMGSIEQDWLGDELPFDYISDDGKIVHTREGGAFVVFQIAGQSYETKPETLQDNLLKGRTALLQQLSELDLTCRFFGVKRLLDSSHNADWPSPALTEIATRERVKYRHSYQLRWYIVLSNNGALKPLIEGCSKVKSLLSEYKPRQLISQNASSAAYASSATYASSAACELTQFVNFLACGELRDDLISTSINTSGSLQAADMIFRDDGFIECHVPLKKYHRIITVNLWPESVSGHSIAELLALPLAMQGEIEVMQVAVPIGKERAVAMMARKQKELRSNPFVGLSTAAEFEACAALISDGTQSMFTTQFQIVLRAGSKEELEGMVERTSAVLAVRRINHVVETVGAPICWFNRMPGREKLLRPLKLFDENIAAIWPLHFAPVGQITSPVGDRPVRLFGTSSGQSYAFQFHVSDKPQSLGHYLVFAPTGAGKSTLIMHLLGGLAKFRDVRSYIFDSNEGARFMVEAMGGNYQIYSNLQLNPLDVGEDTLATRHRIALIMKSMLGDAASGENIDQVLSHAIQVALTVDPPKRTFNAIFKYAFEKQSPERKAFARWVDVDGSAGMHSHIFNAPNDALAGFLEKSFMTGINMNEALSDPVVGPPIVSHIGETISKIAARNSSGFNIFIDEAANLLQNEGFRTSVKEMFREYRKLNGMVGLAFQDPSALHASEIASAVIENVSTLIFFPNTLGKKQDYEPFNLNDEQLEFILSGCATGNNRRVLLVKREASTGFEESVILNIDLSHLGDALRFYRSGPDAVEHLKHIQDQWGDQWQSHL
jgi:type IV secretion system protein VirB4